MLNTESPGYSEGMMQVADIIELSSDSDNEESHSGRFENHRQFLDIWKLATHAIPIDCLAKNDIVFSYPHAKNILTLVKKKVNLINECQFKDFVLKKLLHLFQAYKAAFRGVNHEEKINFLLLDIMASYVKFQCDKAIIAGNLEAIINNLATVLHITFNGNSLYVVMTLLKLDFKESYTAIVYPILTRQISLSRLHRTNDIICYILLILCIRKWKTYNLVQTKEVDVFMNFKTAVNPLSFENKYESAIKVKTFLPHKVPAADEMKRSFTRISDLIGYAISKGDDGTSILLENGSMNLKETIENYFKQYEHLICLENTSSLEKFTQNMCVRKADKSCRTLNSKLQIKKNRPSSRSNNYLNIEKRSPSDAFQIGKGISAVFWDVINPCKEDNLTNPKNLGVNSFEQVTQMESFMNSTNHKHRALGAQARTCDVEGDDCQTVFSSEASSSKFSNVNTICIKSVTVSSIARTGIFQNMTIDRLAELNQNNIKQIESDNRTKKQYDTKSNSGIICVPRNNITNDESQQVLERAQNHLTRELNGKNQVGKELNKLKNRAAQIFMGCFSNANLHRSQMKKTTIKTNDPYLLGASLLKSIKVFHVKAILKIPSLAFPRSLKPLFNNILDACDAHSSYLGIQKQLNSSMATYRLSTQSCWEMMFKYRSRRLNDSPSFGKIEKLREKVKNSLKSSVSEDPSICSTKELQSKTHTFAPKINGNRRSEKRNWRKRKRTENTEITSSSSNILKELDKPEKAEKLSEFSALVDSRHEKKHFLRYTETISERSTKIALSINYQTSKDQASGTRCCYTKRKSESKHYSSGIESDQCKKKKSVKRSCGEYISQECSWSDVERLVRDSLIKMKRDNLSKTIDVVLSAWTGLSKVPSLEAYFIINKIIVTLIYESLTILDCSRLSMRKYLSICSKAKKLQAVNVDDSNLKELELQYEELKVNIRNANTIYHVNHVLTSLKNLKKSIFAEKWLQQNKSKIKRFLYADPVEYSTAVKIVDLNKLEEDSNELPNPDTTSYDETLLVEQSTRIKDAKLSKNKKISPMNISRPGRKIEEGLHSKDVSFCDFVGEYGSSLGSSILDFMPDEIKLDGPIIPFPQNSGNFNEILEHSLSEADISSLSDNDTHDQFFIHQDNESSNMFTDPTMINASEEIRINKDDSSCDLSRKIQACFNTKMYVPEMDDLISKARRNTSHLIENETNLNCNQFWKNIIVGPNDCYKAPKSEIVNNAK